MSFICSKPFNGIHFTSGKSQNPYNKLPALQTSVLSSQTSFPITLSFAHWTSVPLASLLFLEDAGMFLPLSLCTGFSSFRYSCSQFLHLL